MADEHVPVIARKERPSSSPNSPDADLAVVRDPTRTNRERAASFSRMLASAGPWDGDRRTLLQFSIRCATTLLRRRCARTISCRLEADAIASDALLDAWSKAERLPDTPRALRGWIIGAVRIRIAREARRERGMSWTISLDGSTTGKAARESTPWETDESHLPCGAVIEREILSALEELSPRLKAVALQRLFGGQMASTEIASDLKVRAGTVRQRWLRARKDLQQILTARCSLDGDQSEFCRLLWRVQRCAEKELPSSPVEPVGLGRRSPAS